MTTGPDGHYSFPLEISSQPTKIKASSATTSSDVRTVFPDALQGTGPEDTHDIWLYYLTRSTAASPAYAQPGTVVTVTAETSAPPADSKMQADVGSTIVPMSSTSGAPSGWTRWTGQYTVPSDATDGTRTVRACAVQHGWTGSCGQAVAAEATLDIPGATQLTVDGTAPDVVAGRIYPLSGSNTQFSSQPLLAQVIEDGGMTAGGARFTLTDVTTGTSITRSGSVWANGWVKTSAVSLVDGHTYTVSLTVTDRAGNARTVAQEGTVSGGGFKAMRVTNLTSDARAAVSVEPMDCEVGDIEVKTPTKRPVKCTNVKVVAPKVPVKLSGTYHGGRSSLTQTFDIGGLVIQPTLLGEPVPESAVTPLSGTRSLQQPFTVVEASGPVTVTAEGGELVIPTITAQVPASADDAYVTMAATTATAATPACVDPSVQTNFCSPDPVPPVTSSMPVDDVIALPGQLVIASFDNGNPAGVLPIGTVVDWVPFTRSDGTVVDALGATPPEPVSIPGIREVERIAEGSGFSSNAAACAVNLIRYLQPRGTRATLDNGVTRLIEDDSLQAGCSSGETSPPDFSYDGTPMRGCLIERDGKRTDAGAGQPPSFEEYHLAGCWERSFLGYNDNNERFFADWSWVEGQTCERSTMNCKQIDIDRSRDTYLEEVDARLTTITAAHSYWRDGLGQTSQRHPDKSQVMPESCTTTTNNVGFSVSISAPGGTVGGSGSYSKTENRTECSEEILVSPFEPSIHGVDWRGDAPNGRIGTRKVIAANRTTTPHYTNSGFTFRMDIAVRWANCTEVYQDLCEP